MLRERNGGGGVRNINWLPFVSAPIRDRTRTPGMNPGQGWKWQPFGEQDDSQLSHSGWACLLFGLV